MENAVGTGHFKAFVGGLGYNACVGVFEMNHASVALYLQLFECRLLVHHLFVAVVTC